ncbi:amidase domain-containing protein [Salipaludibacillus sp. HK11]|uniref:amidase domain-containing protein n=1 Tax=Salipaludibacillus sp. HK11 TaxID=3394320 RepID=UPI0039FC3881
MSDVLNLVKEYWEGHFKKLLIDDSELEEQPLFMRDEDMEVLKRKKNQLNFRDAKVLKNIIHGQVISYEARSSREIVDYLLTMEFLIIQKKKIYLETQQQARRAVIEGGLLIDDYLVQGEGSCDQKLGMNYIHKGLKSEKNDRFSNKRYGYDRLEAIKYAERWWNDYNPAYKNFTDDCTNYISQCVKAGGAPMRGNPDRNIGWWYSGNQWSFSWTVAHSFRWYLSGSNKGLRAIEVSSPKELLKGDVICYDFNGNGTWQHTTIVVDKDSEKMPLVNAHTTNSRMRYWMYEDSSAWTPSIQYKFFHIIDGTTT